MIVRTVTGEGGDRKFHLQADNLIDLKQFLMTTPPHERWGTTEVSKSIGRGYKWDLGANWNDTMQLIEDGWKDGVKLLNTHLSAILPENEHIAAWRYDVAGQLPDIGRYLAGDPAHMRRHGHPKGRRPVISMLVNICCSGGISGDDYARFGAALACIIDKLENTGRRVELNVSWVSRFSDGRVSGGWTVKQAEDPLDLAAIAFSIAHPAASRRLGFALAERSGVRGSTSYGTVTQVKNSDWLDANPEMYCIQGVGYGAGSIGDAVTRLIKHFNEAAGEELLSLEN